VYLTELSKLLREGFSTQELIKFVSDLSYFHRIQGSDGLEAAGNYIYGELKDLSPVFDVRLHRFSYLRGYGTLEPLTGWWVRDAELRLVRPYEKLLHSFRESRTLVVAHSPGGEVEGEVVYVGLGDRAKYYEGVDVNGKVVLAYGTPYLVYREASRRGAAAILLYREDGVPDDAVPYLGLFLTPNEVSDAKAVALSISRRVANELLRRIKDGEVVVVRAKVTAGYREDPQIPVITAKLGDQGSEVHIFAHYCHPGGTVNDNVSGSATLLELVKAFSRIVEGNSVHIPRKHSMVFLWFPEYNGSLAYLLSRGGDVAFGVNLDMIGERQSVTGSVLNFVRPPPSMFHPYEAVLYYELRNSLSTAATFSSPKRLISIRFDVAPYEVGSDHDVYIHFNIPAVMLNQWPDKFYHTDLDTIDKFDPEVATNVAVGVGSAMYKVSDGDLSESLVRSYVLEYLGAETSWVDGKFSDFRFSYLCRKIVGNLMRYIGKSLNLDLLCSGNDELISVSGERYVYGGPPGIIEFRSLIRKLPEDELFKLQRLLNERRYLRTLLLSLIPLILRKPMTLDELGNAIIGELGVNVDRETLQVLVGTLIKLNLVSKVVV